MLTDLILPSTNTVTRVVAGKKEPETLFKNLRVRGVVELRQFGLFTYHRLCINDLMVLMPIHLEPSFGCKETKDTSMSPLRGFGCIWGKRVKDWEL